MKLILKPAHLEVTMKPGSWPDLAKMEDTIKRAGYTPMPERIDLRLTGKLVKQEDRLALELVGMQSPLALAVAPAPGAAGGELTSRVDQVVELEGRWQPPANGGGGPGSLEVASARPAGETAPM